METTPTSCGDVFTTTRAKRTPSISVFKVPVTVFWNSSPKASIRKLFLFWERDYELDAKRMLEHKAPLSKAMNGNGLGEAVLAVFRATNLLSWHENARVADMLRSSGADTFVRAAASHT